MTGIPFIGENGYYPPWAKGSGRWVFQRTLVSVRGIFAGYAELAAQRVSAANQVIVWVPPQRGLLGRFSSSEIHKERENALYQLTQLQLMCYADECRFKLESPSAMKTFVREYGIRPEEWALICPACGGAVGPDLTPVIVDAILKRWTQLGRPILDNPAASALFKSAPAVTDLQPWIQKNEPSHLELAYLGQQMWPNIYEMFQTLMGHG